MVKLIPFEERPEYKRGVAAEVDVAHMLQSHGAYVIPQYNYRQGAEGKNKGPRMRCRDHGLVLPDHDVMCPWPGTRIWVEVKAKSNPTPFWIKGGVLQHGIDLSHYNDYLEVEKISGNEVWLVVCEPDNTWIGCGRLRTLKYDHKRPINNYGKGGMIYFNRDVFDPLDVLFARLEGLDVVKAGTGRAASTEPQRSLVEFFGVSA